MRSNASEDFIASNGKLVELDTCWICHLECTSKTHSSEHSKESTKLSEQFQPCNCKGSLNTVHQKCLNRWVRQQYLSESSSRAQYQASLVDEDDLPDILCPNCKYLYNYIVRESYAYRFARLKSINWLSLEVLGLLLLLLLQIGLLVLDFWFTRKLELNELKALDKPVIRVSNAIHLFTVLIVIGAAAFNLLQIYGKETNVEVLDKED